jgi:hypothetical protein
MRQAPPGSFPRRAGGQPVGIAFHAEYGFLKLALPHPIPALPPSPGSGSERRPKLTHRSLPDRTTSESVGHRVAPRNARGAGAGATPCAAPKSAEQILQLALPRAARVRVLDLFAGRLARSRAPRPLGLSLLAPVPLDPGRRPMSRTGFDGDRIERKQHWPSLRLERLAIATDVDGPPVLTSVEHNPALHVEASGV